MSARKLEKQKRKDREAAKANVTESSTSIPPKSDQSSLEQNGLNGLKLEDSVIQTQIKPQLVSHFVMNLPNSALEFLDAYSGCMTPLLEEASFPGRDETEMPLIHTHCFTRELEPAEAERDICEVSLSD